MRNYKASNVAGYIAGADKAARPHLKELRALIRATVPKAEEKISWGVPFYWQDGALAGFSAFKKHVGFGFAAALPEKDRDALEHKGYHTGSKTVQISFDQKIPATAIRNILKAQAKKNSSKK